MQIDSKENINFYNQVKQIYKDMFIRILCKSNCLLILHHKMIYFNQLRKVVVSGLFTVCDHRLSVVYYTLVMVNTKTQKNNFDLFQGV